MDTKEVINLMQLQNGGSLFSAQLYADGGGLTSKHYHFKNVLGTELRGGDTVVVEARDGHNLALVVKPNVRVSEVQCALRMLKHLVALVDFTPVEAAKEREADAEDRMAQAEVFERLERYQQQMGGQFAEAQQALAPAPVEKQSLFDPRANNPNWIDHTTRRMPNGVYPATVVQVELMNGDDLSPMKAAEISWDDANGDPVRRYRICDPREG